MTILGVDPGIANTGLAVVVREVSGYRLRAAKVIMTESAESTAVRLLNIARGAQFLMESHGCELVSIERVFHNRNITSSISTAMVMGAVMGAAGAVGLQVIEVTPQQVKGATGFGGGAAKPTVLGAMG